MKKFVSLVKREHAQYGTNSYIMAVLVLLAISIGPIAIEKLAPKFPSVDIRFFLIVACVGLIVIYSIAMATASLNKDIKVKEIWLHNTESIYKLIGVKVIYQGLVMLVINCLLFFGFFFTGDLIKGSFSEYIVFAAFYLYLIIVIYTFFTIIVLFYHACNSQMYAWIGKLGYVVTFVVLFFVFRALDYLPELTFLQVGHVQVEQLNKYLPIFSKDEFTFTGFIDFYILEELFYTVLLIGAYVVACKWIEKVITR